MWGSRRDEIEALQARVDRLEAMLTVVVEHLGVEIDMRQLATAGVPDGVPYGVPDKVVELARAGRTIEAIKVLRAGRGIGLKEAKRIVGGVGASA